jgi:uncharacterized RDD family membrane protein YckC
MKCPKCGYLGFETGDRCRNCGYDFSLHTPSRPTQELPLHDADGPGAPLADFEIDRLETGRGTDPAGGLDLDRLIGTPDPDEPPAPGIGTLPAAEPPLDRSSPHEATRRRRSGPPPRVATEPPPRAPASPAEPTAAAPMAAAPAGRLESVGPVAPTPSPPAAPTRSRPPAGGESGRLPLFDDGAGLDDDTPLITAPRPLRPPLAVRRATPEVPRSRPRTTRTFPREEAPLALSLEPEGRWPVPDPALAGRAADWARMFEPASRQARLGAAVIDLTLLSGIAVAVLYLTLRLLGLDWSDAGELPGVPLGAFLLLLDGGYLAAFTAAGGQSIGKMATGIRVIGDDGRAVDAAGAVLRAVGCGLSLVTLGLGYLPAFVSRDGRTLQDRLAGTRVIADRP